jgi:hypothetical protein
MRMGFRRNAAAAGIGNARIIEGEWPKVDAPAGSVALVNHVTYLTRDIVPFIKKLEQAGRRRVLITVNSVPGPSLQRVLYQLVHGEAEEVVPGHGELINVIWNWVSCPISGSFPSQPCRSLRRPVVRRQLRVPSRGFRESNGAGGVWGRTSRSGSVRSWRRASTNSLPSAQRALSRAMLSPVVKSSSPGSLLPRPASPNASIGASVGARRGKWSCPTRDPGRNPSNAGSLRGNARECHDHDR